MQPDRADVDFVKELRLRTWARLNYVPEEERSDRWHPIVLQEMATRDAELAEDVTHRGTSDLPVECPTAIEETMVRPIAVYVPLSPEPYSRRLDPAHAAVPSPNLTGIGERRQGELPREAVGDRAVSD